MPFPFQKIFDTMDCGAACIRMAAAFHGRRYSLQQLRQWSFVDREGVSMRGILLAAERIGFRALPVKLPFQGADNEQVGLMDAPLPCIVHWEQKHFVVLFKTSNKYIWIADPARGKIRLTHAQFKRHWGSYKGVGMALLLEPTPDFYVQEGEENDRVGLGFLLHYLKPYRRLISQLFIGLTVAGVLQFLLPFLTQAIVDTGIENGDLHFVWLILFGQLMLFGGQATVRFLQSWIVLHIGARVNVSLVSDFLIRLMEQPISYFDAKMTGDLLQRIGDHRRIEEFLTVSMLNILFSAFTMVVFSLVLALYSLKIFFIFLISSVLYVAWIFLFHKRRADADYLRFKALAENQGALIELIQGMQEIKLQNSEHKRRHAWVHIQAKLFKANVHSLSVAQWQDAGAQFIAQLKDIVIIAIAAAAVIHGELTFGMMLAVMFILGQLNAPLQQFIAFVRAAQDAKISLERLGEIHGKQREELAISKDFINLNSPISDSIFLENLSFRYNPISAFVLKNINLEIPAGKVTAIVGSSGSGKTTLLKLLLGFYEPEQGTIKVGQTLLKNIPPHDWRASCGAVLQDGFIFSDTIASNIAESDDDWGAQLGGGGMNEGKSKLLKAVQTAHIQEFIENLPLGYNTKVGAQGNGLSQGQRQRLLIARAVYKDPAYLFFDEATNALDAHNEKIIMENLHRFFENRTVVIVAHRLSTVKNADQILVLEQGEIVEIGTHEVLTKKKGAYYQLVKEQLDLD